MTEWNDLASVLTYLATGGAAFAVNYFLAFIPENWTWWHKLNSQIKFFIPVIVSILVAVGAQLMLDNLPNVITLVQPYWTIIVMTIVAWGGSQIGYLKTKNTDYALKAKNGG
jgi:hypothetical protein